MRHLPRALANSRYVTVDVRLEQTQDHRRRVGARKEKTRPRLGASTLRRSSEPPSAGRRRLKNSSSSCAPPPSARTRTTPSSASRAAAKADAPAQWRKTASSRTTSIERYDDASSRESRLAHKSTRVLRSERAFHRRDARLGVDARERTSDGESGGWPWFGTDARLSRHQRRHARRGTRKLTANTFVRAGTSSDVGVGSRTRLCVRGGVRWLKGEVLRLRGERTREQRGGSVRVGRRRERERGDGG